MRTPSLVRDSVVIIVGCGLVTMCGDPASRVMTSPTPPGLQGVIINGPASIAPNQSGQFTASVRFADGSTKQVLPSDVTWRTSNTAVMSVTASGVATAKGSDGEANLTATVAANVGLSARTATREVVVVPDGTYRLVGAVNDADYPSVAIAGAGVQVTPGGLSTTTNAGGQYKLYGVPADASISVTAPGYQTVVQQVQLSANTTRNVQLTALNPRLTLSGNYQLAIDVVGGCTGLPSLSVDLQHRRYDAVITTTGIALDVKLTQPIFQLNQTARGNRFTGQAAPAGATFTLDPYYAYYYYYGPIGYPNVVERLSNGTFLVIDGTVVTTGTGAGVSGMMSGSIANWDSSFPTGGYPLGSCYSTTLQFTLTAR